MNAFIDAWARFVVARRWLILAATALLCILALVSGRSIPFDNTTERYFVEGDPTLDDFDLLLDLFGDSEYLIIGFEAGSSEDIIQAHSLRAMHELTEFLEYHEYVTQVRSLSNYQYTHAEGDDIRTDDLIENLASLGDEAELQRIREVLRSEELALGTIVTPDLRHARMTARVEYRSDTAAHKIQLVGDLRNFLSENGFNEQDFTLHLSGQPLLNERFEKMAESDMAVLIPSMAALMLLMLFVSFRSAKIVFLPWLVIGAGSLLVLEIQSYLAIPHTTVDQALLPTLIIIGTGVSIHVLVEFFHFMAGAEDGRSAAITTVKHLWKPAVFTAITTSAGFLSLSVTRIIPVKDFAVLGAVGPIILCFLALSVLPALLSFINNVPEKTRAVMAEGLITRVTNKIPDFTEKHHKPILVAGVVLMLFTVLSIPQIQIDSNYTNFFLEESDVRNDIVYFDENFDGVMIMDVILDSGQVDGVKNPEFLREVDAFENWLESRETIGEVNSLGDYLKQINQAFNQDNPEFFSLPTSREMAAQFLLMYDSSGADEDLSDIKDFDDRFLRLSVPIINMPASDNLAEEQTIRDHLNENYAHLNAVLTGGQVLFTRQDTYSANGMINSFLVALIIITLFFILLFRSLKYGLLSVIPSVVPILITGGVAGMSGIYLDIGTTIIGAMTMGIAVDDAIHVMNRYLVAKQEGSPTKQAIARAMNESGRAVVFSSIVLVFGFSVLTFASFVPIILTGAFGAIIMFLALLGDLLFLPAILFWIDGDQKSSFEGQEQELDHPLDNSASV